MSRSRRREAGPETHTAGSLADPVTDTMTLWAWEFAQMARRVTWRDGSDRIIGPFELKDLSVFVPRLASLTAVSPTVEGH